MQTEVLVGPYKRIRLVVMRSVNVYEALDAQGRFILCLTERGAQEVVNADPYRITLCAS